MSGIAALQKYNITHYDQDRVNADVDSSGGGGGFGQFLRIKRNAPAVVLRFLPLLDANHPAVLPVSWHYAPGPTGKITTLPCLAPHGSACPLCDFHLECNEMIGVPEGKPRANGTQPVKYELQSAKYGVGASQKYLAWVTVRETTDLGVATWSAPKVLEMPGMLYEKIFGFAWKDKSLASALVSKYESSWLTDPTDGYAISIVADVAPTFFQVDVLADRKTGAVLHGPLFPPDAPESDWDRVLGGIKDLRTLIKLPDISAYHAAVDRLRPELDKAISDARGVNTITTQATPSQTATDYAAQRRSKAPAAPALPPPPRASTFGLPEGGFDDVPAVKPARAAETAVDLFDEDIPF